jgi:hypothetical protein
MSRPLLALLALLPAAAAGQTRSPRPSAPRPPPAADTAPRASAPIPAAFVQREEEECLGLAFGRWTPALDARAAGHGAFSSAGHLSAPNGRDWASAVAAGRDTTLMLFPAWWPAGVHVRLPSGARVRGDTVRGTAIALVADGRLRPPTAEARAWLVPCGRRALAPE